MKNLNDSKRLESIKGTFLLLDTNILIDASKDPDAFDELFTLLKQHDIQGVHDSIAKLEFLRGARNNKELESYEVFLDGLLGTDRFVMPTNKDLHHMLFDDALRIARVSSRVDNKKMSVPDCLLAAQVSVYERSSGKLLLATNNHKDFPPFLFEPIYVHLVFLKNGTIRPVGFYRCKVDVLDTLSNF